MTDVKEKLKTLVDEALKLRKAEQLDYSSPDEDILSLRQDVRRRIDRLEELLNTCVQIRYRYKRILDTSEAEHQEIWNRSVRESAPKVAFGSDGIAPRERYAAADLASLEKYRGVLSAREMLSVAQEAEDVVRNCYRGLDGYRLELAGISKTRSNPHASEY